VDADRFEEDAVIEVVDPRRPEAREALTHYLAEIVRRGAVRSVPADEVDNVDDYLPPGGRFLIVSRGETVIGCSALRTIRPGTGELRRLWIRPEARGAGIGSRLIDAVVDQSRALGHTRLLLDTNGVLIEALGLYAKHGFEPIERYNDNPDATHFFAKTLESSGAARQA
jgi:GNAT superfamily N-acetyltransferase